jgi:hypothetical protein
MHRVIWPISLTPVEDDSDKEDEFGVKKERKEEEEEEEEEEEDKYLLFAHRLLNACCSGLPGS